MRRHSGSIDITHTPTPLSFYNTFRIKVGCSHQGFGSGSGLDPESIKSVDLDPDSDPVGQK
jgi:hypothetical protein